MTVIAKRTVGELVDAVGALIDMEITTSSSPNKTQVKTWLTDGAVQLFSMLPPESLIDATIVDSLVGTLIYEGSLSSKALRIVAVLRNLVGCTKLTEEQFNFLPNTPYKYTRKNPAYAVMKLVGGTTISVYPTNSTAYLQVKYIPFPFDYNVDDDITGDDTSVPATLEHFIVDYATILYRVQDEEPGQYQLYIAEWKEKIKVAYGIPSSNINGS